MDIELDTQITYKVCVYLAILSCLCGGHIFAEGSKNFFSLFICSSQKECACLFTCVSLQSFSSPAHLPLAICFNSGKHKSAESWRRSFVCMHILESQLKETTLYPPFQNPTKLFLPDRDKTGHHLPICHLGGIFCLTQSP